MDMDAADAASAAVHHSVCKTIECGSIELEQPVEVTLEDRNTLRYTLTAPIDGMRVQVEWLTETRIISR